ncbi:M20 family metallo-hydrolase [Plebeiibacterium marinum]|uniref:M20 family metallo-hydrolase n=1 Tax=Plebeiibacterium marinum TaxID=2992111 RepID=A0AAE3MBD1_9BACT|nr:M20 family metallo-hydrolase [Plebeiobacterium marinum]MCW3804357.1 M20 family metallo-hydrolase [Plebeiobacterium marinum]
MDNIQPYATEAIELLKKLISTESLSRQEQAAGDIMESFLNEKGLRTNRKGNNVWVKSSNWDTNKPVILLNSHIDTVKPSSKWTYNPFEPTLQGEVLYGLGSNDAGGPLVSLLATFLLLTKKEQPYNLIYAATAEEEVSGKNGVESILNELGTINLGIVGEPTQMNMAIAEKGLLVLDCEAVGKSGHAARNEGINAIYKAIEDIEWFKTFQFPEVSELFGPVKMSVTQIEAGSQHNVVPDLCKFVVDVRVNEKYTNIQASEIIKQHVNCTVTPRSTRLNSSNISLDHPVVKRGLSLGRTYYGSPTTSDQALMNFTTLKIGPGDSARSHTADEYIKISEIEEGIGIYYQLLNNLDLSN